MRTRTCYLVAIAAGMISPMVAQATLIDPVSATASTTIAPLLTADNTWNSSGLTAGGTYGLHDDTNTNMWESNFSQNGVTSIYWDLGATFTISSIWLWNYNEINFPDRGVASADVQVSSSSSFTPGPSTTDLGTMTFTEASGANGDPGLGYSITPTTGRFVEFTTATNFGGPDGTGLGLVGIAEIRFLGSVPVPEPASCVLLSLAAAGLLIAARRHRRV